MNESSLWLLSKYDVVNMLLESQEVIAEAKFVINTVNKCAAKHCDDCLARTNEWLDEFNRKERTK